jgi:hypothetical protein
MTNYFEPQQSSDSERGSEKPSGKSNGIDRLTFLFFTILEIILAAILSPGDGGRWIATAAAIIAVFNGLVYSVYFLAPSISHKMDRTLSGPQYLLLLLVKFAGIFLLALIRWR